ncbi:hypothetical protein [Clostridium perfringens]|uniref:hypothetical protein n=1 Tax=Clostridium perfringens TaxID=1502 RepID=UPI003CEF33F5
MLSQRTINLVRNYLLSIGVNNDFIDENINVRNFDDSLELVLPDVCVIRGNRLHGSSSNQTHIHITGEDMLVFYDYNYLYSVTSSTDDVVLEINLIDSNLEHLRMINSARRSEHGEVLFTSNNAGANIVNTHTVKKISKRSNQSPQVQLSKIRRDGREFADLRRNLFTEDLLIFLKYANEENRYLVLGIPSTFNEDYSIRVMEETFNYINTSNNECETSELSRERSALRAVNSNSIARFESNDEDETCNGEGNNLVDLSEGIRTRKKRTERHSDVVKLVARTLEVKFFNLYEGRIDCLAIRNIVETPAIIIEVKTLDGTDTDECSQVMKAFSQLFYYEEFHMGDFESSYTQKVVVFESKISDEHICFFEKNGILVFWVENNSINGNDNSMEFLNGLDII